MCLFSRVPIFFAVLTETKKEHHLGSNFKQETPLNGRTSPPAAFGEDSGPEVLDGSAQPAVEERRRHVYYKSVFLGGLGEVGACIFVLAGLLVSGVLRTLS